MMVDSLMIILGLTAIFSFFIMHFIEMASFGSRVAGRVSNRAALGTTLQLSIVTISRFFLIPFLPVLGYLVESGILIEHYFIILISTYTLCLFMSILILLRLSIFQSFFQKVFRNYDDRAIPIAFLKTVLNLNKNIEIKQCKNFSFERIIVKKTFVACFAYLFLITGFFISFLLAILYPENRLTLSQFTAAFHGVGAIIVAVYIDPMLSRSIDFHDDDISWINNVYSIILGRVLSYLFVLIAVSIFFIYKI
jgi:hypothetical protein